MGGRAKGSGDSLPDSQVGSSDSRQSDKHSSKTNESSSSSNSRNMTPMPEQSTKEARPEAAAPREADNKEVAPEIQQSNSDSEDNAIKLYKSSRLKGYLTMVLASIISWDAAEKSSNVIAVSAAVPSTESERLYAVSVSLISLVVSGAVTIMHLDTITPLRKAWVKAFKPKSRVELVIDIFLMIWWSVATGIQTSVRGIAGDGKGQYSLYFSSWACCIASYWVLERWWVAAGLASLKGFITSWPYRSPGWICILFMAIFTLIWFLDLWKMHPKLDREEEQNLQEHFEDVPLIQWQLIVGLLVLTIVPAIAFVVVEIFRQTNADGTNMEKSRVENICEGLVLLALILCWIPSIIWVTVPKGAASLIGNTYFFSWFLVIFIAETGVWFVHDLRERIHLSLEQKQQEYRDKQQQVIERARNVQRQKAAEKREIKIEKTKDTATTMDEDIVLNVDDSESVDDDNDDDESTVGYMDALTDF